MSCEYEKILVALDGSKGGEVALKEAIEVAKRNDAHLDVLRVMDLNSLEYGGAGIALDGEQIYEIEHDSEEYLLELRRKAIQEEQGLSRNKSGFTCVSAILSWLSLKISNPNMKMI